MVFMSEHAFVIDKPVKREIFAADFRDREELKSYYLGQNIARQRQYEQLAFQRSFLFILWFLDYQTFKSVYTHWLVVPGLEVTERCQKCNINV